MSQSVFRDIWRNTIKRWQRQRQYSRQYPRIQVNQSVRVRTSLGEQTCYLKDFNYEYLVIEKNREENQLGLIVGSEGLEINYEFVRPLKGKKGCLYRVVKPLTTQEVELVKKEINSWTKSNKNYI